MMSSEKVIQIYIQIYTYMCIKYNVYGTSDLPKTEIKKGADSPVRQDTGVT